MPRILQIAKHFFPDIGGIETVTQNLSDGFADAGIAADVLCMEFNGPHEPLDFPYKVIRTPNTFGFGNKRVSRKYYQAISELQDDYDIAIVHMPHPLAVAGVLTGWKKPYILLWHADIPQTSIRWATAGLDRRLIRNAAAVIGPTPIHLEESHRADAIEGKGISIPFPFNPDRLPAPTGQSPLAKKVEAFARGRKLSLSIGRLVPYKGFEKLIEAATSFDDDLASVIIGSGPSHEELEALIKHHGVEDRVLLTGYAEDQAVSDVLQMSYFGCMPSVTAAEMYGVAQVESMSMGKPVVSTRLKRSGVPYVNRHDETGLVVEPGNVLQLADAMNRMVRDTPLYDRLAMGAWNSFKNSHSTKTVIERYKTVIEQVLQKSPTLMKNMRNDNRIQLRSHLSATPSAMALNRTQVSSLPAFQSVSSDQTLVSPIPRKV